MHNGVRGGGDTWGRTFSPITAVSLRAAVPSVATARPAHASLHRRCEVCLGVRPRRSGAHAQGQRVADHVLIGDDPDLVRDPLAEQCRLRLCALALALVAGHWSSWQAARVEVAQEREIQKQCENPIEDKVVEKIIEETEVS